MQPPKTKAFQQWLLDQRRQLIFFLNHPLEPLVEFELPPPPREPGWRGQPWPQSSLVFQRQQILDGLLKVVQTARRQVWPKNKFVDGLWLFYVSLALGKDMGNILVLSVELNMSYSTLCYYRRYLLNAFILSAFNFTPDLPKSTSKTGSSGHKIS